MKTRVQKWGNSLAVRIPKSYAEEAGICRDALVELSTMEGSLVITPLPATPLSLEALLAEITPENLHSEVEAGPAVGNEAW